MNAIDASEKEYTARRDEIWRKLEPVKGLIEELKTIDAVLKVLKEIKAKQDEEPIFSLNKIAKALLDEPSIPIGETLVEGMKALDQFTKDEVVAWVRAKYPTLKFSEKSMQRPLKELLDSGQVVLLKKNQGSKTQAVYGFKRKQPQN